MTHNTREWEDEFADLTKGEIGTDFEGNEYTLWDVCYDYDKDKRTVAEVIADFIHHQLQKARHDWLREEIVRLEGMLSRWVAAYMPADEGKDPSKWGFKTEKEAWGFIEKRLTPCPLDPKDKSGKPCDSCMAEWMVYQIPEVDQALQTIIDRYHSELDQLQSK